MKVKIQGLDCPNCAKALENNINKLACVKKAEINFVKSSLVFESDNESKALQEIIEVTKKIEPQASIVTPGKKNKESQRVILDFCLLLLGIALGAIVIFVKMPTWLYWTLFVISALIMGYRTYYKALRLLLKGTINENLLVTISVIGATAVGEHFEGLMVIALYSIGKILESIAVNKSRKSIEKLTSFKPEYAILLDGEEEKRVEPSQLKIGDVVLVRPGERLAVDGIIVDGKASIDKQSLTGESLPESVKEGDEILSGSIILDGVLKVRATKAYQESTVNKIVELIEHASDKKSKTETVISKLTKWYTLGVIILAVLVWGIVWAITKNINTAVYRGLIFLVVSCPCAFAISVPLSYFAGIGNASRKGILIKGSNYLDACAKLNLIAFDKTGTLTTGEFEVVDIEVCKETLTKEDVLFLASLGEQYSLHPLASAIVKGNKRQLEKVKNVKEVAGEGVYFDYKKDSYFVGRKSENLQGTVVELFKNQEKLGQLILKDKVKDTAVSACSNLKAMNIKTAMLSGDSEKVAYEVASQIGIDEVHAKMLPEAKFEYIKGLKENKANHVGFVGDGMNDAPSLTLADVGFCMGLKGNAISMEASDVVLATDNPEKVVDAIKLSKYTRKIVWQNIGLSAIVKLTFLILGAIGITGMLSAVIADVGVTLIVILNSLRALGYKIKNKKQA